MEQILTVKLTIDYATIEGVKEGLKALAEQAKQAEGSLAFDVYLLNEEPTSILVFQRWANEQALATFTETLWKDFYISNSASIAGQDTSFLARHA